MERTNALLNLGNIRRILSRRDFSLCREAKLSMHRMFGSCQDGRLHNLFLFARTAPDSWQFMGQAKELEQ